MQAREFAIRQVSVSSTTFDHSDKRKGVEQENGKVRRLRKEHEYKLARDHAHGQGVDASRRALAWE